MRAAVAAVFGLVCVLGASGAAASSAGGQETSEQAYTASINGVSTGQILFGLMEPSGFFLRAEDYDAAGLVRPGGAGVQVHGRAYLPLRETPGLKYSVDERRLELVIECAATCFPRQLIAGLSPSPAPSPVEPGLSLDYEVNAERNAGVTTLGGLADLSVFTSAGRGDSSFLVQRTDHAARTVRLQTSWIVDDPARRLVYRLGDSVTEPGAWGAASRFGGVQVGTDLSLDPSFVPFVTPQIAGAATLPSTLDIFVDNTLRATQEIRPGPFSIVDLPVITGTGEVRVVARDILGRERTILAPFYVTQRQLKPGLALWSVEAGALRRGYGYASADYGAGFVSGTYRRGLTDSLTGELRGEAASGHLAGGVGLSLRTWAPGSLDLVGAASRQDGLDGYLSRIGYTITRGQVTLGISQQFTTSGFRRLGDPRDLVPPDDVRSAHLGFGLGSYGSLSLGYLRQHGGMFGTSEVFTASYARNVGDWAQLNLSGLQDGTSGHFSGAVTLTVPLGERREAVAALQRDGDGSVFPTFTAVQNAPTSGGPGARAVIAPGRSDRSQVDLWYDSPSGYAEIDVAETAARLWARGRFMYLDGVAAPARSNEGAAVLVETPGYSGVGVLQDNRRVARTGGSGRVIVTGLRPYQENMISIDPLDLPAGASVGSPQVSVTPRAGSAARATFAIKGGGGRLVVVRTPDGAFLAPGTEVAAIDTGEVFTAGYDGQVFITGLTTARRMRVQLPGGACEFTARPAAGEPDRTPPSLACEVP